MKSIVRIQRLKLPEINLQSPCNQTRMHVKINEEAWLPNAARCQALGIQFTVLTKLFLSKRSGNFLERHGSGQVWSLSETAQYRRRTISSVLKNLLSSRSAGTTLTRQPRFRELRRFVSKFRADSRLTSSRRAELHTRRG